MLQEKLTPEQQAKKLLDEFNSGDLSPAQILFHLGRSFLAANDHELTRTTDARDRLIVFSRVGDLCVSLEKMKNTTS